MLKDVFSSFERQPPRGFLSSVGLVIVSTAETIRKKKVPLYVVPRTDTTNTPAKTDFQIPFHPSAQGS